MSIEQEALQRPSVAINLTTRQGHRLVAAAVLNQVPAAWVSNQGSDGKVTEAKVHMKFELFEFLDNDQFSNFDSFLHQLGQAILYFPEDVATDKTKPDTRKISNILAGCQNEVETILLKRSSFLKKADTSAHLQKLVGRTCHATNTMESEVPYAMGCADCIVHTLRLQSEQQMLDNNDEEHALDSIDGTVGTVYEISYGSLEKHMRLDSAAIEAVNLLPRADHPSKLGSIYGILDNCKTKQGSRLLDRWIRHPLLDEKEINQRLDMVEEFIDATQCRNGLREGPLKAMPDIEAVINKMYKKKGGLSEMFRLYIFANSLHDYVRILDELVASKSNPEHEPNNDEHDNGNSSNNSGSSCQQLNEDVSAGLTAGLQSIKMRFVTPLRSIVAKFSNFQRLVEHVVDMEALPDLRVNATHDENLQSLDIEMQQLERDAENVLEEARHGWASFADIKLEMDSPHGVILRTTRGDDERQLRANCRSVHILSILKNGVHLTTPQLEKISDRYAAVREEYLSAQQGIVEQAVATALTYVPLAESVAAVLAELDVLLAFATATALSPGPYVRPVVHARGSGIMRLTGARHPCVELMDSMHQFIANDYDLQRGASQFQIVTGPNMGGKSTYIRAVGCIAILAQIGMFVPCDSAELSVVDCILARVGAGDAVQKGVSTFMAEMLESSVILQTATRDSLVIIDELGRGTSTFDGFGLAWAISDYLVSHVQCLCLFATHFHELTALETLYPAAVANRHVAAHVDNNQVVMLYKLEPGPCTQSFGIHVAKSAGFPSEVLQTARKKARSLEHLTHNIVTPNETAAESNNEERPAKLSRIDGEEECEELETYLTDANTATKAVQQFRNVSNFESLPPQTVVLHMQELFATGSSSSRV